MAQMRSVPLLQPLFHPLGTPDAVGSSLRTDLGHTGTEFLRCEALGPAGKVGRDFSQGCAVTGQRGTAAKGQGGGLGGILGKNPPL